MPSRKDEIVTRLLSLPSFAGRAEEPRVRYNRRWMFLYYLSGLGMKLYNMYRHRLVIDDYKALFEYAVRRDGFEAQRDADLPIYFAGELVEGATHRTDLLVEGKILVMIFRQPSIGDDDRRTLESHLTLTHTQYGFLGNFGNDQFYSEWYYRDPNTSTIERVKLM